MLAMGIILTVLISMTIGYIATVGSTPDYTPKSNTVFKIKLDGTLADNPTENPFSALMGDKENMLSLKDLLETIRIAKQNDKIAGIYIESGFSPRVAPAWRQSPIADRLQGKRQVRGSLRR